MKNTKTDTSTKKAGAVYPVFIPRLHKNDDALFVAVNGKRMLIRKGETVMVPREYYEVIENSRQQSAEAERFILSNSNEG